MRFIHLGLTTRAGWDTRTQVVIKGFCSFRGGAHHLGAPGKKGSQWDLVIFQLGITCKTGWETMEHNELYYFCNWGPPVEQVGAQRGTMAFGIF